MDPADGTVTDRTAGIRDVVTLLRLAASDDAGTDAFVDAAGRRLTFGEWDRRADGLAAGLAEHGVGRGDVVCLLLPSSLEYMVAYQAVVRLGAVVSGINIRLGPSEIAHLLNVASPRLTLVDDDLVQLSAPWTDLAGRVVPWAAIGHWTDAEPPPLPVLDAHDPVLICWTGGTTGRPRGAWFDHRNLAAVARATGALSAYRDRRLSPIPFPHVGTMTRAWDEISRRITTVITPPRWTAGAALSLIERERVTVAQGVPTQWELILRDRAFATTDLSSLRLAGVGGAPVPPDLLTRMHRVLGVPVVNRYAATEAGGVISGTRPEDPDHIVAETVGRASDGVELRVADPSGRPLPAGEIGVIQVRSEAVMRGYWRDEAGTAAALDPQGWLTVGDLGSLDAEGNLTLAGRKGDMYVRGGYNVYPVEVERRLSEHPSIDEVSVVAVPDDVLGEIGVAAIVSSVRPAPSLGDLRSWVSGQLADYKAPDDVLVLDALPLTAIGKIDRQAVAESAARHRRARSTEPSACYDPGNE